MQSCRECFEKLSEWPPTRFTGSWWLLLGHLAEAELGRGGVLSQGWSLPSSEAEFSPEGEVVPRRVHVPSRVIREQWLEWGSSVWYSRACVIVVGESRWDCGLIVLCWLRCHMEQTSVLLHLMCTSSWFPRSLAEAGLETVLRLRWARARRKLLFHKGGPWASRGFLTGATFARGWTRARRSFKRLLNRASGESWFNPAWPHERVL
jgi:hypothetical protein